MARFCPDMDSNAEFPTEVRLLILFTEGKSMTAEVT